MPSSVNEKYNHLPYLALAPTYAVFRDWCDQHKIKHQKIGFVGELRDIRGRERYGVILFGGWKQREGMSDALSSMVLSRALRVVLVDNAVPVVEDGVIVDWLKLAGR